MDIAALGFDVGETLLYYPGIGLSWEAQYREALAVVAVSCGRDPTTDERALAEAVLRGYNTRLHPRVHEVRAEVIFGEVLTAWGGSTDQEAALAAEAFFGYFHRRMHPYDDSVAVLTALRERGIPIGVLTDVPYGMASALVHRDLVEAGVAQYIGVVLTSVDVGVRKPDPRGFVELARRLGVAPETMLFVGNEPKDVDGARAAGSRTVLIDRAGASPAWGQDITLTDLNDLVRLLSPSRTTPE